MDHDATQRVLTVGVWLTIDAVLDNAVSNLVDSGLALDDPRVVRARGLRKRGWAANRVHPERGLGPVGWPPRESRLDIVLSDDDVDYLMDVLVEGMQITARILAAEIEPSTRLVQAESQDLAQRAWSALKVLRRREQDPR